jgi:hypothetical protein
MARSFGPPSNRVGRAKPQATVADLLRQKGIYLVSEGFGVHLDFRGANDDIPELDMRARRARMGPPEKCI